MKKCKLLLITLLLLVVAFSCTKAPEQDLLIFNGDMNKQAMSTLKGIYDVYQPILNKYGLTELTLYALVNKEDKTKEEVNQIVEIAIEIHKLLISPTNKREKLGDLANMVLPLYEKYIPLSEVENYLSNRYRDIRGLVSYAGDGKLLEIFDMTSRQSILNLNYRFSPFDNMQFAGYAVIRFSALFEPTLALSESFWDLVDEKNRNLIGIVPYREVGLPPPRSPFLGTGFTPMCLGFELMCEYDPLIINAELYEVTLEGNEILRGVLTERGWKPYEGEFVTRSLGLREPFNTTIKNGLCYPYENNLYPALFIDHTDSIRLYSDTLVVGFERQEFHLGNFQYMKNLRFEVEHFNAAYTYTIYNGDTLQVRTIDAQNRYHLTTSDSRVAERQQMTNIDFGTWRMYVPFDNIPLENLFDLNLIGRIPIPR